jgi:hypothetical protein
LFQIAVIDSIISSDVDNSCSLHFCFGRPIAEVTRVDVWRITEVRGSFNPVIFQFQIDLARSMAHRASDVDCKTGGGFLSAIQLFLLRK